MKEALELRVEKQAQTIAEFLALDYLANSNKKYWSLLEAQVKDPTQLSSIMFWSIDFNFIELVHMLLPIIPEKPLVKCAEWAAIKQSHKLVYTIATLKGLFDPFADNLLQYLKYSRNNAKNRFNSEETANILSTIMALEKAIVSNRMCVKKISVEKKWLFFQVPSNQLLPELQQHISIDLLQLHALSPPLSPDDGQSSFSSNTL